MQAHRPGYNPSTRRAVATATTAATAVVLPPQFMRVRCVCLLRACQPLWTSISQLSCPSIHFVNSFVWRRLCRRRCCRCGRCRRCRRCDWWPDGVIRITTFPACLCVRCLLECVCAAARVGNLRRLLLGRCDYIGGRLLAASQHRRRQPAHYRRGANTRRRIFFILLRRRRQIGLFRWWDTLWVVLVLKVKYSLLKPDKHKHTHARTQTQRRCGFPLTNPLHLVVVGICNNMPPYTSK